MPTPNSPRELQRRYYQTEDLSKYKTGNRVNSTTQTRQNLNNAYRTTSGYNRIPNQMLKYEPLAEGMSKQPPINQQFGGRGGGVATQTPSAPPPANAAAGTGAGARATSAARVAAATAARTAANAAARVAPVVGGVTLPGVAARAVVGAVALVLLDPFGNTSDATAAARRKRVAELMPPDSPKILDPAKIPFFGGQSSVTYDIYVYDVVAGKETKTMSSIGSDMRVQGPVRQLYMELVQWFSDPPRYRFYVVTQGRNGIVYRFLVGTPNAYFEGFQAFRNPRLVRADGQPDTGGNPPATQQPTYTTNITNIYNNPPAFGESTPPQPPLLIMPIGGGTSAPVAPAPSVPSNIPQLQPSYLPVANPSRRPGQSDTDPDIAQSPPAPGYPIVTKTPSSGITAEAAEASRNTGVQVTPSTGVPPQVAPVPEEGQRPSVENPERVPTFAGRPQAPEIDRESITQELLQIEQQLIQARSTISSLTPQSTSQSISNQIQEEERRLTNLRTNINTVTPETISTRLQQAEQELEKEERRLTNLEPSSTTALQKNQIQQTRQRIIQLRNRVTNPPTQPETPAQTPPQTTPELDRIREQLTNVGIGIALLTPTLIPINNINNNTTPEALRRAARQGTCETLQPGGCLTGLANNAQAAANNSNQNNNLLNQILNILRGANETLLPFIWQRVQAIDTKLGAQMPGGISGFLQTAFRATRLDKIINALTLITVLHNAAMLSRNLGQTLGELTSQALATIGIKDENGSPLDINGELGKQVNNLMSTVLGAETWAGTKLAWNKANAILSSASQIVYTVRSMFDSGREVTEWIANNTGKIGNALKRFRLVGENAYPHMAENVSHQNAWMLKVQRYREGVDSLDDAASSLQGVLGEVQNIQQEAQELNEQKQRFDKAIQDAQPKTILDNNPVKEKAAAAKTASQSPTNQADVFRGEGETTDA